MEGMATCTINSPLGILEVSADEQGIQAIRFTENMEASIEIPSSLRAPIKQLSEYFAGTRKMFSLTLNPDGTPFQKRVWNELLKIEFGTTISYQELADRLGDPKAVRAVGGANGKNPIAIVIPCHRVIGASGKLVGYGGGMERKKWLLRHEQSLHKIEGQLF